ncbi:putative anti-sigma regulatory factor, serine/th reonine protein kinase [Nocardioides sp. PD653]|nr:Putative anti-sigma regulatory factor, serine/threonine protein kinase [Nocardioides sp. PD653-B2]GAW53146.1 putative anti-sigma regulatory factor, serine/th reonine protein kinase [Nocardioides sp. PD653]
MPTNPDALELAHEELALLWDDAGPIAPTDRMRFELAVIEILGNIVEHAWIADDRHPSARRLTLELSATTSGWTPSSATTGSRRRST